MYITFRDKETYEIRTCKVDKLTEKNIKYFESIVLPKMIYLYNKAREILESGDINDRYKTYYITKKNGKKRRLDEPDEELKSYMKEVKNIFTQRLAFIFPQCVYSYVEGRSTKQLVERHTGAKIIMKFDIKDFFSNCTLEFMLDVMKDVYPFCLLDQEILETILKACMINFDGKYRLPQGAPSSPMLSNIAMIPADYILTYWAYYKSYVYSRYADDIFFSYSGSIRKRNRAFYIIREYIKTSLSSYESSTLELNLEKCNWYQTRFKNVWLLGISVGEDMKIGSKKKNILKATIFSFLMDTKNDKQWSVEKVRSMIGTVNYFRCIEPDFVDNLIHKYEEKTKISYQESVENILCG